MRWTARTRFISHACETLGDPSDEFEGRSNRENSGLEDLLILEFPPFQGHQSFTYLTAGLSLSPIRRNSQALELIAYSSKRNLKLAENLFFLCEAIADAPSSETFKAGHFVHLGTPPHAVLSFQLSATKEPDAFLDFPNIKKRPEDARFLMAFSDPKVAENFSLLQVARVEQ